MYSLLFGIILLILLQGCTLFHTDLNNPNPALPENWSRKTDQTSYDSPWWKTFDDPQLNMLVKQALEGNLSLQQTWARLAQAQAAARKAGANRWPELEGSFGATHNRTGGRNLSETTEDGFSLGLTASYELDLWGRVRAGHESATFTELARAEDLRAAALSLSGQIGQAWINLLSLRQKQALLHQQLALNQDLLELVQYRFTVAQASALDVYQQQQTVTTISGSLITLEAEEEVRIQQLTLLTGRPPQELVALTGTNFPDLSQLPPGGVPGDLLQQRPDIRSQLHQLQSSNWSWTEAKADRLPKLQLSGSYTYNDSVLQSLLDTWVLRLAANLSAPIFDGGSRRAEVDRTQAVVEEELAAYRETVLTAVYEVEEGLVREQQYRRSTENLEQQVTLAQKAYREATYRYLNGISDYLAVLREQSNLITSQLDRITNQENLLTNRITIHLALGGSWPDTLQKPDSMSLSSAIGTTNNNH